MNGVSNCRQSVRNYAFVLSQSWSLTLFRNNAQVSGENAGQGSQIFGHEKQHGRLHDCPAQRSAHVDGSTHTESEKLEVAKKKPKNKAAKVIKAVFWHRMVKTNE